MSLVRLTTAGPRALSSAAGALRRSAVDNALSASAALTGQVADRRALAPLPYDSPGALSRLSTQECLSLLRGRSLGRLAYVARPGVPDVVPVNYVLDGTDVLVRSGVGPKLQAAERREVVALEVDDVDEAAHTGWSVVVAGRAERLSESDRLALPADVLPTAWALGPRHAVIRLRLTRIEGRRLT